jgi:predicted DNA-binding protein
MCSTNVLPSDQLQRLNMSTTTIRIEDELKARVTAAAQRGGKTAHAFILEAISQTVEQVELDNAFNTIADQRWANIQATSKTVAWQDAKTYLAARARGEPARKPSARKRTA